MKVKIFKTSSAKALESEINDFLSTSVVTVKFYYQHVEHGYSCLITYYNK